MPNARRALVRGIAGFLGIMAGLILTSGYDRQTQNIGVTIGLVVGIFLPVVVRAIFTGRNAG